jgi:hypothetical protein
MPKSNLSLSNLYRAWSGTVRSGVSSSLNAANGMAGTAISMSSFSMDNVAVTMPFTYIVDGTSENVTFAFTGQGLAFDNRIKPGSHNYQFMIDFGSPQSNFSVGTAGASTAINALTFPGGLYTGSVNGNSLLAYFEDGYNNGATGNYGFNGRATKTIYNVDAYNSINSDILCVATDTQILLADGTTVEAGDLYVGDTIKTFVPDGMPSWLPENDQAEWYWWYQEQISGNATTAPISNIYFSFIDQYVSINDGAIKTTHAHPFYAWDAITNTYQFTRAEDVAIGDKLIKYNNVSGLTEEIDVTNVEFHNKNLEIATITVDVAHTYLANGFVSHNKGAATAPIPWLNLVCYLDPQFTNSYNVQGQTVINDLAGYTTGFNLTGGNSNPAKAAPTFNTSTPKSLTFAANKLGVKQNGNASGTNNSFFNTTAANGYSIIAFVKNTAGDIFQRGTDYKLTTSTTISFTSTPNGNATTSTQTLTGWQMIAVTAGANPNGTIVIYRNGTAQKTEIIGAGAATTSTSDIELMKNNTGELGSFFFYQRSLSSTEITAIWNNLKGRYGL